MKRRGHSYLDLTARPDIGALALVPQPAWLWEIDGAVLNWTNVAGARLLGAGSIEGLLDQGQQIGATPANLSEVVARLSDAPHMAELQFAIGAERRAVWCLCSRPELDDGTLGVLAVATDEAAALEPLSIRAGRLVRSLAGEDMVAAVARPDGRVVAASDGIAWLAGGAGMVADLAAELGVSGERLVKRHVRLGEASRLIGAASANTADGDLVLVIAGPAEPAAKPLLPEARGLQSHGPPPARFTFSLDADQRFIALSSELSAVVGTEAADVLGSSWDEIADRFGLDGPGVIREALSRRDTRSGVAIRWPIGGEDRSAAVEITVMPSFGRNGVFEGFRGFGVFRADSVPAPVPAAGTAGDERQPDPGEAPASNIVRLRSPDRAGTAAGLSGDEQDAFRRIADELRSIGGRGAEIPADRPAAPDQDKAASAPIAVPTGLLDRIPVGMIVFRDQDVLFANRALLDRLDYPNVAALAAAGGIEALFAFKAEPPVTDAGATRSIPLRAADGRQISAEARLHVVPWVDGPATMLSIRDSREPFGPRPSDELDAALTRLDELEAVLDTATDGTLVLDGEGRILRLNRSAEALFGVNATEMVGRPFVELLAEESQKSATDYLDGLARNGVASVLNDGREVIGRVPAGGLIPLFMTMGRLSERGKFCAVLRDITQWKNAEEELVAARRTAELANQQKSEFLAKISHEIRTPLNAIIGFSDVIIEERFGPIGSERYREYLRDIRLSGTHLMSLINDLLDLSKIESGKLELSFTAVPVNRIVQESVALMQPEANRRRIIIRTSLADDVPKVVADERSLRQIVLNLLSNAVKFNVAAGQVIVSTAVDERGEVIIRIRDTGIGMSEKDILSAMKPFQQVAGPSRFEGTGLGLPLTKALVEANRATFKIDSVPNQGTLVRISFPVERVLQP